MTGKQRREIAQFFRNRQNYRDDIKKAIAQMLEYVDINIKFREYNSA